MILRLRRSIALVLAVAITLLTLGRVRVDASGGPGAPDSALDPGTAAIAQPHATPDRRTA